MKLYALLWTLSQVSADPYELEFYKFGPEETLTVR